MPCQNLLVVKQCDVSMMFPPTENGSDLPTYPFCHNRTSCIYTGCVAAVPMPYFRHPDERGCPEKQQMLGRAGLHAHVNRLVRRITWMNLEVVKIPHSIIHSI
ncbi:hypothetical protein Ancab_008884 [Ancistrocladus abbreviatus]